MIPQDREQAYEALDHNRDFLYKITQLAYYRNEYSAIYKLFTDSRTKDLRKLLLKLFKFAKGKKLIHYRDYYCFFITTKEVNKLRNKTTHEVSNRWMNYLSLAGFFVKIPQYYDEEKKRGYITKINLNMKRNTKNGKPINHYGIVRYDLDELDAIEKQLHVLNKAKITPGNIEKATLLGHDLGEELAKRQFPQVKHQEAYEQKQKEYDAFKRILTLEILENGYSTRKKLEDYYDIDVGLCLRYFKPDIEKRWYYKQPNKEQKEQLKLDSDQRGWLFFEREEIKENG